jgi:hypothetical protein
MIQLSRQQERKRRRETMFQQRRDLTRTIHLTPERRLSEIILDTRHGDSLPLTRVRSGREHDVDSSVHPVGQFAPVGSGEDTLRHDLRSRDPTVLGLLARERVLRHMVPFRHVTDRTLLDFGGRSLVDCFDTEGDMRGDGLEVRGEVGARQVGGGGVVGFEGEGVVLAATVVLEREHRLGSSASGELHIIMSAGRGRGRERERTWTEALEVSSADQP